MLRDPTGVAGREARAILMGVVCAGVLLVVATAVGAKPVTSDVTVAFDVASQNEHMVIRLYRLVLDDMTLIAEVNLDAGQSSFRFKDSPSTLGSTIYELRWVTENGEEYFLGRAGRSVEIESSAEVVTIGPIPQLLCSSDGLVVNVAKSLRAEADFPLLKYQVFDVPKPPP